ncbi:MAG TPA: hypothetical protein EYG73_00205 [Arcobacter sp.]|nr:hypothetical protein [Arcobacter sp.]
MKKNRKIILFKSLLIPLLIMGCSQKILIPEDGILQTKSLYEIHKMKGKFVSYEEYKNILRREER